MWDGRRRRRDESLATLETGVCHRQAELGLSHVAHQPTDCCNGAAGVTSCSLKSKRNRVQGKMQVESEYFSGCGMKGTAGDWVGGLAHHPVPFSSHHLFACQSVGSKKEQRISVHPENSLSWSFLPCCLPVPMSLRALDTLFC